MSAEASTAAPPPPKGVIPPSDPGGRSGFLSDVIVELGFAGADEVEEAIREARSGSTVAQVLVESGAISEEQLARATGERYGLAYIDLDDFEVDRGAAAMIRPSAAKRYQAVPVGFVGGELLVAMTDPADSLAVNDIAVMTKLDVQPAATTRSGLEALLAELAASAEAEQEAPAKQSASSAVFWQAGEVDSGGGEETLPADGAAAGPSAGSEEAARARGELDELRRKLAGAETELVKARAELEASQAELAAARESASGTTAEHQQLIIDLTAARESAERANAEVEQLRAQVASVEAELAELRDDAVNAAELEAAREAATAERDAAAERLEAMETELAAARESAGA